MTEGSTVIFVVGHVLGIFPQMGRKSSLDGFVSY